MTQVADALVVGGGPAGTAAAARLAAGGLRVVLCERQAAPRPAVCGEFVSAAAATELAHLGVTPARLGALTVNRARLFVLRSGVAASLPASGYGLSRERLDGHLLELAARSGVEVRRGTGVRQLERRADTWQATLGDRARLASRAVVLATGKHELRGYARSAVGVPPLIGFKMHWRLRPDQAAALGDAVELFPYDGGYAGLQRIETGAVNLCLVIAAERVRGGEAWPVALARLRRLAPALADRLEGARPLWPRPASIARIPYGYLCPPHGARAALYPVGDQAAVIPSLVGEGIAIALRSGRLAADAVLAGVPAECYVAGLRGELLGTMRRAGAIDAILRCRLLSRLAPTCALLPGILPILARLTRLG
jgi:menaquinone-9 beta-reductase